jgi:hypothetical protein
MRTAWATGIVLAGTGSGLVGTSGCAAGNTRAGLAEEAIGSSVTVSYGMMDRRVGC